MSCITVINASAETFSYVSLLLAAGSNKLLLLRREHYCGECLRSHASVTGRYAQRGDS